jgi:integrase
MSSQLEQEIQPQGGTESELWLATLKSNETRAVYKCYLKTILGSTTPDSFLTFARSNKKDAENLLLKWVLNERARLRAQSLSSYLAAVRALCAFNEVELNWLRIKSAIPKATKGKDRAVLPEEIRKIYETGNSRLKFVISVLASSGIRIGAFDFLTIKDLEVRDGYGILTVYRGEPEEYITFVSMECIGDYRKYLEERRIAGETITPDSPLVRQRLDIDGTKSPIKAAPSTISFCLWNAWKKVGLATGKREFKMAHGFRKYFKTRLENAGMKTVLIETLMGHATGLNANYYRPTTNELATEYLKHQHVLFVSEAQQVRTEIKDTVEKNNNELMTRLIYTQSKLASVEETLAGQTKTIQYLTDLLREKDKMKTSQQEKSVQTENQDIFCQ